MKKIINILLSLFTSFCFFSIPISANSPSISYCAHVSNIGWQNYKEDGEMAGTTGNGYKLEGLKIKLNDADGSVEYNAHVENIGWQGYKSNDQMAGTTGQSLAVEAIKIRLSGSIANQYDVYYRLHVEGFGWLGWACNNEMAGSEGCSLQAEAIEIKIVPKGSSFNKGASPYIQSNIAYNAHVSDIGWQPFTAQNGSTAGTTGQGKRMEALQIRLLGMPNTNVVYQAHVSNVGWMDAVQNGATAGTTGRAQAIEAMSIYLTGTGASYFDIYYRLHVAEKGWLGWACNGEKAGTTKGGLQAEAIEIKLVPKGNAFNRGGAAYYEINNTSTSSTSSSSKLDQFMTDSRWKVGTAWSSSKTPEQKEAGSGTGCNAYVRDYAYFVYGKQYYEGTQYKNINEIRAGDVVHVNNKGHWFIVLGRNGNTLDILHGNYGPRVKRSTVTIQGNKINFDNNLRDFDLGYHLS